MKKFIITLLVIAVLGTGGYFAYQHFFASTEADDTEKVHVDSVSALMGEGAIGTSSVYTGMVEPQKEEKIEKDSDNKVSEVYVKEGDEVKAGDVLFEYDVDDIELQLESAKLEYESEEAEITTQQSTLEKLNTQLEKASDDDKLEITLEIQSTELDIKKKQYELVTKKSDIATIEKKLNNSKVTSPIDGIIKSVSSDSDDSAGGSDEGFISIYSLGNYRVKGSVSEINRKNLYVGQTLKVISRLNSDDVWYATVTEIADQQDSSDNSYSYYSAETSSKYTFYAELENIDGLILGQHVYLSSDVEDEEKKEGVWIPSYYICENEDGTQYVYSAKDGEAIKKVTVVTGEVDDDEELTEIKSGLTKDDYIAFPSDDVQEGMIATTEAVAEAVVDESTDDGDYTDEGLNDEVVDEDYTDEDYMDEGIVEEDATADEWLNGDYVEDDAAAKEAADNGEDVIDGSDEFTGEAVG